VTARRLPDDWYDQPLPDNVVLGERSWLYSSFAFRHYRSRRPVGLRVGRDSGLYDGTFFDLGPEGEVTVGDHCTLVGVIVCTNGRVEIDDYALVAHEVVLADSFAAAPGGIAGAAGADRPVIRVGRNAWIAAGAVLLAGADIGEGAIVGAAAVVDFAVPPGALVAGNPARVVSRPA